MALRGPPRGVALEEDITQLGREVIQEIELKRGFVADAFGVLRGEWDLRDGGGGNGVGAEAFAVGE